MAKGFRRQGEWQVGFQQRSMPSDVKRKLQRNKLMEQQAKEEINKRVQNAAEQAKEEQRQTNNILRVSNYEAQLASQFSNTLQNLLTNNTEPIMRKTAQSFVEDLMSQDVTLYNKIRALQGEYFNGLTESTNTSGKLEENQRFAGSRFFGNILNT